MSQITRCPACGTLFKVVPDQLRISEGWVRCGQCAEVFDATAHMQAPIDAPAEAPIESPSPAVGDAQHIDIVLDDGSGSSLDSPVPFEPLPSSDLAASLPVEEPSTAQSGNGWPQLVDPEVVVEAVEWPLPSEPAPPQAAPLSALARAEVAAEAAIPIPEREAVVQSTVAEALENDREEDDTPVSVLEDVSFVRAARRKAFWRKPLVRTVLGLFLLLALVALMLQVAVQERDRIVAWQPRTQPWLQALCQPLHCVMAPLRQIDAVVIDGSSFNKSRGDTYQFGVTLKNTATTALAMPALELTLTDAQDQPLLRRVLQPEELAAPQLLPAHGDWSTTVPISLAASVGASRVAGYRLLAFYP
ncbi:MAG TPA: DUF3426 domain-containing protein [Burkholderiaceae bacterium]